AVAVLTLDGKYRNVVLAHQAGGYVVLRRKWIRGAEHYVGAAIPKCNRQIRGFRSDVQAGGNTHSLQRLILDEFLADDLENLHRLIGPVNAFLPHVSKFEILDIARHLCWRGRHTSPVAQ